MTDQTDIIENELWKLLVPVPYQYNNLLKLDETYDLVNNNSNEIWIQFMKIDNVDPFEEFKINVICRYPTANGRKEIFNDVIKINARKIGDINVMTAQKFNELSYFIYSNIRTLWRERFEGK